MPGEVFQQQPRNNRAKHHANASHSTPNRHRFRTLFFRKSVVNNRKCSWHHESCTNTHHHARNQKVDIIMSQKTSVSRTNHEQSQSKLHDFFAAITIRYRTRYEQQTSQTQGVNIDNPGQFKLRNSQITRHARQRHVQTGICQHHTQQTNQKCT